MIRRTAILSVALALGIGWGVFAAGTQPPLIRSLALSIRNPSTFINNYDLAAATAKTITIPTFAQEPGKQVDVIFSGCSGGFWYSVTGTASEPSGDVTDGGGSGFSPVALRFAQGATLSVYSTAGCKLALEGYLE